MGDLQRAAVTLSGIGLHGGEPCAVTIARTSGPTAIETTSGRWPLGRPCIAGADRGVRIALDGGGSIELVEHLAAAFGGMGAHLGVVASVSGGEVPLLDGGARAFVEALVAVGAGGHRAPLRVTREVSLSAGEARYELVPSEETRLEVRIEFDHPRIGRQETCWEGDPADFRARIAPARTFGFARDRAALSASGRARHVDLSSVIVFGELDLLPGCELRGDDEPVRHKLLDLVGDLALHGGPPRGLVRAFRPGHAATHAMIAEALRAGHLVREETR